jgi:hypothetical protein
MERKNKIVIWFIIYSSSVPALLLLGGKIPDDIAGSSLVMPFFVLVLIHEHIKEDISELLPENSNKVPDSNKLGALLVLTAGLYAVFYLTNRRSKVRHESTRELIKTSSSDDEAGTETSGTKDSTSSDAIKVATARYGGSEQSLLSRVTSNRTDPNADYYRDFKFNSIQPINLRKNYISLGGRQIHYDDIVDVELLEGKTVEDLNAKLTGCNYIRIVAAEETTQEDSGEDTEVSELTYHHLLSSYERIENTHPTIDEIDIAEEPDITSKELREVKKSLDNKCNNTREYDVHILNDWPERDAELRIEGIQEGSAQIHGNIGGRVETKGTSTGVQVGPFTRSKSRSQGSIDAELGGRIEDNTFTSEVDFFQYDEYGLYIHSDPILSISYEEIDRVMQRSSGLMIEINETTYSITGDGYNNRFNSLLLDESQVREAVEYMSERIRNRSTNQEVGDETSADKIRALKELNEEGAISDEEFEEKKNEFLDDF